MNRRYIGSDSWKLLSRERARTECVPRKTNHHIMSNDGVIACMSGVIVEEMALLHDGEIVAREYLNHGEPVELCIGESITVEFTVKEIY